MAVEDTNPLITLRIHSTKINETEVQVHLLRVRKNDDKHNVEYFRNLIENELNIPRVCHLSLSIAGTPLDPIETMEVCSMSDRIWDNPNPITLHYYAPTLAFNRLSNLLEQIDNAIDQTNIPHVQTRLERLIHFHNDCHLSRGVGTQLYLVNKGFIHKLRDLLVYLHSELENEDSSSEIMTRTNLKCISDIIHVLWSYADSREMLLLMSQLEFTKEFLRLYFLANTKVITSKVNQIYWQDICHDCHGIFQMIVEVKDVAIRLGNDETFLKILKTNFLRPTLEFFDCCLQSNIFLSISIHKSTSVNLYCHGIYLEILEHFVANQYISFDSRISRIYSNVSLIILNSLKTPNLILFGSKFLFQASRLLGLFLRDVSIQEIIQYEHTHNTTWNIIEHFIGFFFVPSNSILASVMFCEKTTGKHPIVDLYFKMAHFSLKVLLRQEKHRSRILAEKLLELLIIADWRCGGIQEELRLYFSGLHSYPVPSLHDICAVQAYCYGLGDYSDLMES
ncbi:hypothetical protein LOD99_13249 [Oopsacas minuta]|uniref:Uncharacterized protein n=1 Tax=Oopsacas minuta TaxID=111878 RepID=A0AAV7JBI0_9METZ|nr:hypothetical protein LOD99_13249 [Oopsacas minuta]